MSLILNSRVDALRLLKDLGASDRLLMHLQLVGEAADLLIQGYHSLGVMFNEKLVELGVAVHDAGKIVHRGELDLPGTLHESAGYDLLIRHGVSHEIARCCISHGDWNNSINSFEELSVALADKLWKGKREEMLELLVIDAVAKKLSVDRWAVYTQLDLLFENIASGASDRLNRSCVG